jgi:hypothetical protein
MQSQSLEHDAPLAPEPIWAQHVSEENEHAPEAQKQPPGTTQSCPAPFEFDGQDVAQVPPLQPW